jgi:hypothetical protein
MSYDTTGQKGQENVLMSFVKGFLTLPFLTFTTRPRWPTDKQSHPNSSSAKTEGERIKNAKKHKKIFFVYLHREYREGIQIIY